MKIVILDGYSVHAKDLNWDLLRPLGELTVYDRTPADQVIARMQGAEIVLTNKCRITGKCWRPARRCAIWVSWPRDTTISTLPPPRSGAWWLPISPDTAPSPWCSMCLPCCCMP